MILSNLSAVILFIFKNVFAFSEQFFIENIVKVTYDLKYNSAVWVKFVIAANLVFLTSVRDAAEPRNLVTFPKI